MCMNVIFTRLSFTSICFDSFLAYFFLHFKISGFSPQSGKKPDSERTFIFPEFFDFWKNPATMRSSSKVFTELNLIFNDSFIRRHIRTPRFARPFAYLVVRYLGHSFFYQMMHLSDTSLRSCACLTLRLDRKVKYSATPEIRTSTIRKPQKLKTNFWPERFKQMFSISNVCFYQGYSLKMSYWFLTPYLLNKLSVGNESHVILKVYP